MAAYQMGQYRYSSTAECMTQITATKSYRSVSFGDDSGDSTSFQDIQITTDEAMLQNTAYFLSMSIPRDLNYDLSFNIKLYKTVTDTSTTEVFQQLKNIKVKKGGNTSNVYGVALYDANTTNSGSLERIVATIPAKYNSSVLAVRGQLYIDEANKRYYLGQADGTYKLTTKVNYLSVLASWKQDNENLQYDNVTIVFTPIENGFNRIVLEMVREAEDYNIQYTTDEGDIRYGRKVQLEYFDFNLYTLSNLVTRMNPNGSLTSIGVNGHPGLLMSVNGSQIRIGPSGYYALENIIPISNIGIVARNARDSFVIDYQYEG